MNMNLANYLYNTLNELIKRNDEDLKVFNDMVAKGATREEQMEYCSKMKKIVDLFYELKPLYESYVKEPTKEKEEELLEKFDKIIPPELKSEKNKEAYLEANKKEVKKEDKEDFSEMDEELDDDEFPDIDDSDIPEEDDSLDEPNDDFPDIDDNDELNHLLHDNVDKEMSSGPEESPVISFKNNLKSVKEKAKSKSILRKIFGKKDSLDDKVNELILK